MRIILNGKETEIEDHLTLLSLLDDMKIPPQRVACELNARIVKRDELASARISDGDQIEILQMIGGG